MLNTPMHLAAQAPASGAAPPLPTASPIAALPANVQSMLSAALNNPEDSSNALSLLLQQQGPGLQPAAAGAVPAPAQPPQPHGVVNAPQPFARPPTGAAQLHAQQHSAVPAQSAVGGSGAMLGHVPLHLPGSVGLPPQPNAAMLYAPMAMSAPFGGGAQPPPTDPAAMLLFLQQHQMQQSMLGQPGAAQQAVELPPGMSQGSMPPGGPPLRGQAAQMPFGSYPAPGSFQMPGPGGGAGPGPYGR